MRVGGLTELASIKNASTRVYYASDTNKKNGYEIDSFDLKDGKLEYKTRKTKKPISKKMLLNILSQYYNGDPNKASELNNYILANREENTKETILRKIQSDS